MLKSLCFVLFYFCFLIISKAQTAANWGIEPVICYGKIIKHTPKFTYTPPSGSGGINCNIIYKTYGKRIWHQWQHYPTLGLNFGYYDFGNEEVLGKAFTFFPNITVRLGGNDKLNYNFMFGSGIAYLNRYFNYLTNPQNNSIGSSLNNISSFQFDARLRIKKELSIFGGFGLTHFSNGTSSLPNLGINLIGLNLGVQYIPNPVEKKDYIPSSESAKPNKRFGLSAHGDIAFIERTVPGGPKYPIYIASLAGTYAISKVNHFMIGLNYENNKSDYYFYLNSTGASTEEEAKTLSTQWMAFIADEFYFYPFSFVLEAGNYIDGDKAYPLNKIYTKLSFRYYVVSNINSDTRVYLAIHLKAHKFNAQYISWGLGITL